MDYTELVHVCQRLYGGKGTISRFYVSVNPIMSGHFEYTSDQNCSSLLTMILGLVYRTVSHWESDAGLYTSKFHGRIIAR